MGRIKSTKIKKAARQFLQEKPELFSKDFNENKITIANTMPSKWIRNRVAGQITRTKKAEKQPSIQ